MRSCSRFWLCVLVGLTCATVAVAQPTASIADSLKALQAALAANDLGAVYQQAHAISAAVAANPGQKLIPADSAALALAQMYLAAESLQAAMAQGLGPAEMRQAIATLKGLGITAPPQGVADVKLIRTGGQELDIREFLVPGKTTIVDLFSVYCGWCMKYAPKLKTLAESRPDIAIVEFDINRPEAKRIDAGSPFGKQYKVRGVPLLQAFGPGGELVAADTTAVVRLIKVPIKP